MVDLDSLIIRIIKEAERPLSIGEVLQSLNDDYGVRCTYDRAFDRLMSLTSHRYLDTEKTKQPTGGYKRTFSLVTA